MDYVQLTADEWCFIVTAVTELNKRLSVILEAPRCPKCGSRSRKGQFCGTCGFDYAKQESGY